MKLLRNRTKASSAAIAVTDPTEAPLAAKARRMVIALEALFRRLSPRPSGAEAEADFSLRDARAFGVLMHLGTARMTDFAHALGVPLSTATHTVNRLVRRDLVTRAHSDRDRRLITVQLSDRGSHYATAFLDRRFELAREMLASLSPGEREMLLELIGKIANLRTK